MKEFEVVLNKMCEMVGADLTKVDRTKDWWFHEYSWTSKQEQEFSDWFVDYLINNKKARDFILNRSTTDKKLLRQAVNEFLFNYGWKIEDES